MTTASIQPGKRTRALEGEGSASLWQDRVTWVLLGVAFAAFLAYFHRWFYVQHLHSKDKLQDWGHSYAVPLIAGALVWVRRGELSRAGVRTFWPALAPLVLCVVAYPFFIVGLPNHLLQGLAVLGALGSLALLLLGVSMFRLLALPLLYLVFMITLPEQVMIKITFQLQLIASKGAWLLLAILSPMLGYQVDVDGNQLFLTTSKGRVIPLNVAEACSGMRMVIAFFALAGAVAMFSCRRWWERLAVMMTAAPVAVLMNVVRVAVLGLGSVYVGEEFARGDTHMLIGTLLLIPGLFLFMGVVWALSRMVVDPEAEARRAVARGRKPGGASPVAGGKGGVR